MSGEDHGEIERGTRRRDTLGDVWDHVEPTQIRVVGSAVIIDVWTVPWMYGASCDQVELDDYAWVITWGEPLGFENLSRFFERIT